VDASTIDLQELLIDRCATERLLLVYTTRPEFEWRWPLRGHHTLLTLSRLPQRQVHEMIRGIAPERALSDDVVALVATRTDGVPLFVEELTRLVLERFDACWAASRRRCTTPSWHASTPRPAKEIAQVAAVLGREFSYAMLAALAPVGTAELDAALGVLVDAELLYVHGSPPEATCVFKHVLVQEAAYEALLGVAAASSIARSSRS
jgi:predicted ATPase